MHEASLPSIPAVVAPFSTELGDAPDDAAYIPANVLPYYVAEAVLGRLSWHQAAAIVEKAYESDWDKAVGEYWLTGATGPMNALAGLAVMNAELEAARIVTRSLLAEYRNDRITAFTCLWSIGLLADLPPDLEGILWEAESGADEVRTNPALEVEARVNIHVLLGRLEAWSSNA